MHKSLTIILLLISSTLTAQTVGSVLIQNYNAKEHKGSVSNFEIIQDSRGVLYFGNIDGLLRYDGSNWKLLKIAGGKSAQNIALNVNNQLFVETKGELGFIDVNENGAEIYKTISTYLDSINLDFRYNVLAVNDKMIYVSRNYLLEYHKENIKVFRTGTKKIERNSFVYNGQVLVNITGEGLFSVENGIFKPVVGGEMIIGDVIASSQTQTNGQFILCESGNTYMYDGTLQSHIIYNEEARNLLSREIPSSIWIKKTLNDTSFVIGTEKNGIYYVSNKKIRLHINQANGLSNNEVRDLYSEGNNLWVTTQNGISKITGLGNWTHWPMGNNDEGLIWEMKKHNGQLFMATTNGLYKLSNNIITKVGNSNERAYHFFTRGDQLYFNNQNGINIINNNDTKLIYKFKMANRTFALDSNRYLVQSVNGGIKIIEFSKNDIIIKDSTINTEINGMSFSGVSFNNDYWFTIVNTGVFKMTINGKSKFTKFNSNYGLPTNPNVNVLKFNDELFVSTHTGFYKLNKHCKKDSSDLFIKDSTLINTKGTIHHATTDVSDNVYFIVSNEMVNKRFEKVIIQPDNTIKRVSNQYNLLSQHSIMTIYPDPEAKGILWFEGSEGLFKYEDNYLDNPLQTFTTLINKVTVGDSVMFHGTYKETGEKTISVLQPVSFKPYLSYSNNNIIFEYSATYYDDPALNKFSYYLEGFDKDWSEWGLSNKKEYTNLDAGNYTFKVKSKNLFDTEGNISVYKFTILNPWYQTFWAILLFMVIGVSLIWLIVIIYTQQLRKKRRYLQLKVEESTSSIIDQKNEIEKQIELLREQAEEIMQHRDDINLKNLELEKQQTSVLMVNEKLQESNATKDKFFSIISHDLKGPLNSLTAFSNLLANNIDHISKEEIQMLAREFDKSLKNSFDLLVNLLQWSRSQTGTIDFVPVQFDFQILLKENIELLKDQAKNKNISITVLNVEPTEVWADKNSLNTVVRNLLSNAIKFTPEGGQIILDIKRNKNEVIFLIKDNGVGIRKNDIDKLFRIDTKHVTEGTALEKGTGLGLILCKEFIEKNGGEICVESKEGVGSTFSFKLPKNS